MYKNSVRRTLSVIEYAIMILCTFILWSEEATKFVRLESFSCQCKIYSTDVTALTGTEISHL